MSQEMGQRCAGLTTEFEAKLQARAASMSKVQIEAQRMQGKAAVERTRTDVTATLQSTSAQVATIAEALLGQVGSARESATAWSSKSTRDLKAVADPPSSTLQSLHTEVAGAGEKGKAELQQKVEALRAGIAPIRGQLETAEKSAQDLLDPSPASSPPSSAR
jgi:hypothetical protein